MKLEERIIEYFRNRLRTMPESFPSVIPGRVRDVFESVRAEMFAHVDDIKYLNLREMSRESWGLSCRLYTIAQRLSCVLAVTPDNRILWLDDHLLDDDFVYFCRCEKLIDWLPTRTVDLLNLLVETKFTFSFGSILLNSVGDIPVLSNDKKQELIDSPRGFFAKGSGRPKSEERIASEIASIRLELQRQDDRLLALTPQIHPPIILPRTDGGCDVSFNVWARHFGRLLSVKCTFGRDGSFSYSGVELEQGVGKYFVHR